MFVVVITFIESTQCRPTYSNDNQEGFQSRALIRSKAVCLDMLGAFLLYLFSVDF